MRKEPKRAPLPVLMILLPFVAAMTLWDLAGWLVSIVWDGLQQLVMMAMTIWDLAGWLVAVIWDGLQRLGPRFQGFILGMWAGMIMFMFAATMAMFG